MYIGSNQVDFVVQFQSETIKVGFVVQFEPETVRVDFIVQIESETIIEQIKLLVRIGSEARVGRTFYK